MALKVGELFASFGIDSSGLSKTLSGIEKQCSDMAKGLAVTGTALTAAVTRPIINAAKDIYETGSGFDAQMSRVAAISGAAGEELEALRNEALRMGSTTSFTSTEAAEALEYMGMAGWKSEQMLAALAPVMDLAAASGENLGTVSDIVTDAMTAFGMSADEAGHFADVLAAASTNANTNVGMMGESFKYVAPLAGTMGYSVDDVAVALGLMANNGIKSTQAGTSLQRILQNMIGPTDKQAEAMKYLGLSLYDSNGNIKDFASLMADMRVSAKKSGFDVKKLQDEVFKYDQQLSDGIITQDEYDAQIQALTKGNDKFLLAINDLAGARGLSGLLSIMNASDEDFAKLTMAIHNSEGAAKTMADTMLDNARGAMVLFDSAVDGLKVKLWGLVEGPFTDIVEKATEYVNQFANMDEETQKLVLRFAGLAAAAGPALGVLGGLVGLVGKLIPLMAALNGPAALVGGTLGLFAIAAIDANNEAGKAFEELGATIEKQLEGADEKLAAYIDTVSARIPDVADSIVKGLHRIVPGVVRIALTAISRFAKTVDLNASKIGEIGKTVTVDFINGLAEKMPELLPNVVGMITSIGATIIANAGQIFNAGISLADSIVQGILNTDWVAEATKIKDAIITGLSSVEFGKLVDIATKLIGGIVDALPGLLTVGGELIGGILDLISSGIQEMIDSDIGSELGKAAAKLLDGLLNGVKNLSDNDSVKNFMKNLGQGLAGAVGQIGNLIGEIVGYILSPEGLQTIYNVGVSLAGLLLEGITSLLTNVDDIFFSFVDSIGQGIIDAMTSDGVKATRQVAAEYVALIENGMSKELEAGSADFAKLGIQAMGLFAAGINDEAVSGDVREFSLVFWEQVKDAFAETKNLGAEEFTQTVGQYLGQAFAGTGIEIPKEITSKFWADFYEAYKQGFETEDWSELLNVLAGLGGSPLESYNASLQQAIEETKATGKAAAEAVKGEFSTLGSEIGETSAAGMNGLTTAITSGKEDAETASLEVSDAVVQKFLLTMSEENGNQIGSNWISSIIAGMNGMEASIYGEAERLGNMFDRGIANGIMNGAGAITSAARSAANSALSAAKNTLGIHSPSRVAEREVGYMFDEGIAIGLLNHVGVIEGATRRVAAALMDRQYIGEPSRETVYTARQNAQAMAQETANATSRTTVATSKQSDEGRMVHVTLAVDGQELGDVMAPIIDGKLGMTIVTSRG